MGNAMSHFLLHFISGLPNNCVEIFKVWFVRCGDGDDGGSVLLLTKGRKLQDKVPEACKVNSNSQPN